MTSAHNAIHTQNEKLQECVFDPNYNIYSTHCFKSSIIIILMEKSVQSGHSTIEQSQNTVLLASTQAVYKAPHSTVRGLRHIHTLARTHAVVAVAVRSLRV